MDVKLVVTQGSKRSQVIELRSEETIIGRHRACDLRIPSAQVSRRHCRLSFRGDRLMVEDLTSANGSFLNGVAVEGTEPVQPGDLLNIGPVTFRVEYQPGAGGPRATAPARAHSEVIDLADYLEEAPTIRKSPAAPRETAGKPAARAGETANVDFEDLDWHLPLEEDVRDILSRLEDE